jgi:hypothetical protein
MPLQKPPRPRPPGLIAVPDPTSPSGLRIWSSAEFLAFLDFEARAIFGVSAEEFIDGYFAGRWIRHEKWETACDLSSAIPFALPALEAERREEPVA